MDLFHKPSEMKRYQKINGEEGSESVEYERQGFQTGLVEVTINFVERELPECLDKVANLLPNNYSSGDMPKEKSQPKEYLSPTNSQWFSSSWNHKVTRRGL